MAQQEVLMDESVQPGREQSTDSQELPSHWQAVQLGDVAAQFISGGTPSTQRPELWDGTVPWTTSAPIDEYATTLGHAQRFITSEALVASATHMVPQGNLLVGTRVGVGKAVVNLLDIAISQDLTGVVLNPSLVVPEFIAFQFKSGRIQNYFDGRKRGTTIKGISRFDLQELSLCLPPLPEQRAVAHVLRTVQDAVAARRRELEMERERKAALMQHLFTHGTRGEPTKMTEIGEMPESWRVLSTRELADVAYGLTVNEARRTSGNVASYLTVANVTRGSLRLDEVKQIGTIPGDIEHYRLEKGDVLLVEGNGNPKLLGSAAMWNGELPLALHQNHLIRVRPNQRRILSTWLMNYFNSDDGRAQLLGRSKTSSGLHSINSHIVANLLVPVPSISEQEAVVEVALSCEAKVEALETETATLEELFRALLEELMTGRLSTLPLIEAEGTSTATATEVPA